MSDKIKPEFDIPFKSVVQPVKLGPDDNLKFRCHPGVSCFNECCKHADITLAPYDIIRLKDRLGISATEFLKQYTVPATLDAHGLPLVKMRTMEKTPACQFVDDEKGCTVYEDRPSACRYYPLGLMSMHKEHTSTDESGYILVKEEHCKGHEEDNVQTVAEYRKEQGVEEYDELNRAWYQIILKKQSSGPAVGKPSEMSLQLFFMCCYDLDRARNFYLSKSFRESYDLDDAFFAEIEKDDIAAMKFGMQFLKQILFGEVTIKEKSGTYEKRLAERKDVIDMRKKTELDEYNLKKDMYEDTSD